jgi:hypothetical protein
LFVKAPHVIPQLTIPQFFDEEMARDFVSKQAHIQKKTVTEPVTDGVFFLENFLPDVVNVTEATVEYVNTFDGFVSVCFLIISFD